MAKGFPRALEALRLIALWRAGGGGPLLHVTTGEGRAEEIARFVSELLPATRAAALPPWDALPYDWASPSARAMGRRMALLRRLADPAEPPVVVVASVGAVLQRLPPVGAARGFAVRLGEPLDLAALRAFCEGTGYWLDERVDEPGEVAIRGEVVDVFPAASDWPYRIEIGDDAVTAIRRYDPATQRSVEEVAVLVVDAASELPGPAAEEETARGAEQLLPEAWPSLATLRDYMPVARLSLAPGAAGAAEQALALIAEAHRERERAEAGGRRVLPPERLHLTAEEWAVLAEHAAVLEAGGWEPPPPFAEELRPRAALREFVEAQAAAGRRVIVSVAAGPARSRTARRLREATGEAPEPVEDWEAALALPGTTTALVGAELDRGVVDRATGVALLSARDVLGSRAAPGLRMGRADPWVLEQAELHEGDLVVHLDHGVARLGGLEPLPVEGETGEAIRLDYAEGERLLVPAAEAGRIWRYGTDEGEVALDRLHGGLWEKRRRKIVEGIAETARSLIAAAEARQARRAPKLVPESAPYERLAARFPFEPTPDQAGAIGAVLEDMASGTPMNRLVVGDVGFGKTEVAIRAAAACVFAGRQAMILAPTTVLATQHARNLARRFEGLGVEIAHLSRLVSAAEAKRVKAGLREGSIRLVVGTQALLGKGIQFAGLGLAVIDEEQRLGLADKEKVRAMVGDAHLLSMTATPIPRTLQAALVGLQDLSVIATPPARRRPIRTLLSERDPASLRQALLRERRRGGQSFVVVPRVEDVGPVEEELRSLLPGLSVRIAHGELPAKEIDAAMVGFAEGDGDVLLATSIIESGLDVPRANTMVVLRPDLFGLAQLHQLRGRVGRGGAQAYCLLVTEPGAELSPATLRRLGTLQALDRLGAGMAISAQDLDLRGGGELFGERQSGHVRLIGLPLYQELLADAIRAAKGGPADRHEVEFQAGAMGALPQDYIPEPEVRINLYHRLARLRDSAEAERMAEEIADRFGPPPPEVEALLRAAQVRTLAASLGVTRISAGPEAVALDFGSAGDAEARFAEAVEASGGALEWVSGRLVLRKGSENAEERIALVHGMLEELA